LNFKQDPSNRSGCIAVNVLGTPRKLFLITGRSLTKWHRL